MLGPQLFQTLSKVITSTKTGPCSARSFFNLFYMSQKDKVSSRFDTNVSIELLRMSLKSVFNMIKQDNGGAKSLTKV